MSQLEFTDTEESLDESAQQPGLLPSDEAMAASLASDAAQPEIESPQVETRRVGFRYLVQQVLTSGPLVAVDLTLLLGVIALARVVLLYAGIKTGLNLSACFWPIATGFLLISAELGLYPGIRLSPVEEFRRLSMAVTSIFAVWVVSMMLITDGLSWQRCLFLALAYGMYLVALPICRGTLRSFLARSSWWGFPTLVCGYDAAAVKAYDWLANNRRLGLIPVGVVADPEVLEITEEEPWYAGPWSRAREAAEERNAYWSVVVPSRGSSTTPAELIDEYLTAVPHIYVLSDLCSVTDGWAKHQQFEGLAGTLIQQNLMLPLPRITKRCMDLVASLIGGILLLPLLFYIAVAVKMSSRGAILYGHDRIGKDGKRFKAWKFRSMFENSSDVLEYYLEQHPDLRIEWEKDHKLRYDPRVTRIGRFIRKTSLDELPQIWNVVRGQMSLVGPRPIVNAEVVKYGPYYGLYTMVTPGITGVWQISGRNNTTYEERVQLDSYYVRNWSPWLDLYLLIRTIRIVLFADGAY
ncbi:MAG: undecaprenyl-phosphate galactose phosphotransferase WbaP [Pirellulales bacterium]